MLIARGCLLEKAELSRKSCSNSLRTAEHSRDASRSFFLKFLRLSIERANEIRCGAERPRRFSPDQFP